MKTAYCWPLDDTSAKDSTILGWIHCSSRCPFPGVVPWRSMLGDYRRDRRKDALLQEHGYFVLRFVAEDVGAKLDMVLDAALRALAHLGS